MMGKQLSVDFGPDIVGWRGEVYGSMVCMTSPQAMTDPSERRKMIDLVRRQGGDCCSCRGCPIGQMSS